MIDVLLIQNGDQARKTISGSGILHCIDVELGLRTSFSANGSVSGRIYSLPVTSSRGGCANCHRLVRRAGACPRTKHILWNLNRPRSRLHPGPMLFFVLICLKKKGFCSRNGILVARRALVGIGCDGWLPAIPGRYVLAPIHMVATASLNELATTATSNARDSRRFRPNLLIEADGSSGFIESEWLGSVSFIGGISVKAAELTKRCAMTFISQPGFDEEPEILRNIVRRYRRTLGVSCQVEIPRTIEAG